jgi:hypothetical protein
VLCRKCGIRGNSLDPPIKEGEDVQHRFRSLYRLKALGYWLRLSREVKVIGS